MLLQLWDEGTVRIPQEESGAPAGRILLGFMSEGEGCSARLLIFMGRIARTGPEGLPLADKFAEGEVGNFAQRGISACSPRFPFRPWVELS